MKKKELTGCEVRLLEAIDGCYRANINMRNSDDAAVAVDPYLKDSNYTSYQSIINSLKSLTRRGYIWRHSLTELGLSITEGTVNLRFVDRHGNVVEKAN